MYELLKTLLDLNWNIFNANLDKIFLKFGTDFNFNLKSVDCFYLTTYFCE